MRASAGAWGRPRPLLLAAAAALASTGAAGDRPPIIDSVVLCGVERFDPDDLLEGLESQATSWLPFTEDHRADAAALGRDVERVLTYYQARGYFDATCTSESSVDDAGARERIVLRVREGLPSTVRGVTLRGLEGVDWGPSEEAADGAPLRVGAIFRVEDFDAAKERLRGALDRAGYLRATVVGVARVVAAEHRVDVTLSVTPNARYVLHAIAVEGTGGVSARAVRRTADLAPGAPLSNADIRRARTRLLRTGVFGGVTLEAVEPGGAALSDAPPRDGDTGHPDPATRPVDLRVDLAGGRATYVRLAGGYEVTPSSHGPRARATWGHGNFLGDLRTLELGNTASYRFLASRRRGLALSSRLSFMQPGIFEAHTRLDAFLGYERRFEESFTTDGAITGVGLARRFGGHMDVSLGYELEATAFDGLPPDDVRLESDFVDPYLLSSLVANVFVAFRDDPLFATRGWTLALLVRDAGGPVLRGDFEFLRLEPTAQVYWPLWVNRLVLASRVTYGAIVPYGAGGGVPITHRLYAGGPASARAWGFGRLSPRSTLDPSKPIGGRGLLLASVEPRVRVVAALWLVPFLDVANVTASERDSLLRDPSHGVGLGALYVTPLGPVRLDFGWRLNAQRARYPGESRWALNFSFGAAYR